MKLQSHPTLPAFQLSYHYQPWIPWERIQLGNPSRKSDLIDYLKPLRLWHPCILLDRLADCSWSHDSSLDEERQHYMSCQDKVWCGKARASLDNYDSTSFDLVRGHEMVAYFSVPTMHPCVLLPDLSIVVQNSLLHSSISSWPRRDL